jgi:acyl carrier protein
VHPELSPRQVSGTAATVARVLSESLGVAADRITPEARLIEDLEIDSLDRIELVFALESAFGIEIPDSAIAAVRTVGDISDRIEAALGDQR